MKKRILLPLLVALPLAGWTLRLAAAEEPAPAAATQPELRFEVLENPYPGQTLSPAVRRSPFLMIMRVNAGWWLSDASNIPQILERTPKTDLASEEIRKLLGREGRAIQYITLIQPVPDTPEPEGGAPSVETPRRGYTPGPAYPVETPGRYTPGPAYRPSVLSPRVTPVLPTRTPLYRPGDEAVGGRAPMPVPTRGGGFPAPAPAPARGIYEIAVAAASVEQAKELARALVTIYNVGYVRFERQELLKALEEAKEKLAKLAPELEKAQDQAKRDQEATNALPDIPEQTINDLKTRRWLLDVDLAGVRARVEAAQKLSAELKGDAAKTARYEQTEVIKTTAQIDLADLLARQERVTVILADAVKRAEAAHRLRTSAGRVDGFKAEMDQVKDYARAMQDPFESPVLKPLEVIGKITIQPITWPVQESKPGEGLRP